MFDRAREFEERPKIIELGRQSVIRLYEYCKILETNYTWVNVNDTLKLRNMTDALDSYLKKVFGEQESKSLLEEPAFK